MSSSNESDRLEATDSTPSDDPSGDHHADEQLAQLEQLRTENRRLRRAYAATQQTQYRRTALGLYGLGLLSVGAAVLFPDARSVLFALGATGLFAGLLTYYLTPEQFVAAHVSERIATAHAATLQAMIVDLGLQEIAVYLPLSSGEGSTEQPADVLLFVPQAAAYSLPPTPRPGLVTPDDRRGRGLLAVPTGGTLLREFERTLEQPLSGDPDRLAGQLADGLTDQFELAESVQTETTTVADDEALGLSPDSALHSDARGATRMVVRVEGPTIESGPIDDPYTSFVSAGVANTLETPVEVAERLSPAATTFRFALVWESVRSDESAD
jgi:hypothetical protein